MTDIMTELCNLVGEQVQEDRSYQKKSRAISGAALAVLDELELLCGEKGRDLLEVYGSLEAQGQAVYERALVREALKLGMELGRLSVS